MEQRTGGMGTKNNGNQGQGVRSASDIAGREMEALQERFGDVSERVTSFIRERPGTSILIALGCGFLIGKLLRS